MQYHCAVAESKVKHYVRTVLSSDLSYWLVTDVGAAAAVVNLGTNVQPELVACGKYFTCTVVNPPIRYNLTSTGKIVWGQISCWGTNDFGQLGLGDGRDRNQALGNDTTVPVFVLLPASFQEGSWPFRGTDE